jgi:hypothetical protein
MRGRLLAYHDFFQWVTRAEMGGVLQVSWGQGDAPVDHVAAGPVIYQVHVVGSAPKSPATAPHSLPEVERKGPIDATICSSSILVETILRSSRI